MRNEAWRLPSDTGLTETAGRLISPMADRSPQVEHVEIGQQPADRGRELGGGTNSRNC